MYVCAVSISKNQQKKIPKKRPFLGIFPEYVFPFHRYLFSSCRLTHRRGGRIFSDVEKTTIFWESSLCEKITFFRPGQSCCSEKFQKKWFFFWESFGIHFVAFFFFVGIFFTVLFGLSTTSGGLCEKTGFFRVRKKWRFFGHLKMLFFRATSPGWRTEKTLVISLAGWLSGWLADSLAALAGWLFGNWLRGWLAGYSAISYLAGWLAGCLVLAIWMAGSPACYLAI